jgi:twinkle protein
MMSEAVKIHQACPDCGSTDALAIYVDHTYCFSCEAVAASGGVTDLESYKRMKHDLPWESRGISPAVRDFYNVSVSADGSRVEFPYYSKEGHTAKKVREEGKDYFTEGEFSKCDIFGLHTLDKAGPQRGSTVIVTEGEADALAAFQLANRVSPEAITITTERSRSLVPVFSIKSGARSAERDFKNFLPTLEEFDRVFICFDNDEQGKSAAEKAARLISPGKAYVVSLEHKDACEYSRKLLQTEFLAHLKAAKCYTPSGILNASDNFEGLWAEQNIRSLPFPFAKLQEKTLGTRAREIVTWAAGTGVGKSSILRELQHYYIKKTDTKIGVIALEESVDRTRRGILAVEANDRLHLNEVFAKYSKEQIKKYFDVTLGTGRVYLYDHFGSMRIEDLLARVRYMVVGLDCRIIFIDHLSILVSGLEITDERKAIDRTMTMLRQLTEETGCCIHLVTHLRRLSTDRSHEEGMEVNLGHLRGSHGIAQISDTVVAMERDTQSDDPVVSNTVTLRVLKCRYTGDVGEAGKLFYNKKSGRLEPLTEEF